MNNKDFISRIAKKTGRTEKEVSNLVTALKMVIAEAAESGDEVSLPGLGVFKPVIKDEYINTDETTGKRVLVPPSSQTEFEPAASLLTKIKTSYL